MVTRDLPPTVQLNMLTDELDEMTRRLEITGRALAQAEHDYKIMLTEKALKLRADGMAVTQLQLVVYGYRDVAKLRLERDIAQAMYDANREAINTCKLKIRVLHEQIQQEWGQAKYQ